MSYHRPDLRQVHTPQRFNREIEITDVLFGPFDLGGTLAGGHRQATALVAMSVHRERAEVVRVSLRGLSQALANLGKCGAVAVQPHFSNWSRPSRIGRVSGQGEQPREGGADVHDDALRRWHCGGAAVA